MASEKTITQVYKDHEESFTKHLRRAKTLKEKQVHKLRVEIKNLRVLFDLLKVLSGGKSKIGPMLNLVGPLFKKAGRIRTHQLNLTLAHPHRLAVVNRFKKHLLKEEEKAGNALVKAIRKFDEEKFNELHKKNVKAFKHLKPLIIRKESEIYVRGIFAKIRTAMFDMHQDEVLHDIRLHLKTVKNIGHLLDEISSSETLKSEIQIISQSYDKIGQWHDGIVFVEALEKYLRKKESPEVQEKSLVFLLKLKEKNEKTKLLIAKKLRVDLG